MKDINMKNINEPLLYFRVSSDYMTKRNSISNYLNEFKISLKLMNHFGRYDQLFKIILKLIIRISPSFIGKIAYKIIRD